MKISAIQIDPSLLEEKDRFDELRRITTNLAEHGCELALFPELYVSGYNTNKALHELAENEDGRFLVSTRSLAKELKMAIAYGYPERHNDKVYNSAIVIDKSGDDNC